MDLGQDCSDRLLHSRFRHLGQELERPQKGGVKLEFDVLHERENFLDRDSVGIDRRCDRGMVRLEESSQASPDSSSATGARGSDDCYASDRRSQSEHQERESVDQEASGGGEED